MSQVWRYRGDKRSRRRGARRGPLVRLAIACSLLAAGLVAVAVVTAAPVLNRLSWAASLDSTAPSDGVIVRQRGESDCGAAALKMVLEHHGLGDASLEDLEAATRTGPDGASLLALKHVAEQRGLTGQGLQLDVGRLKDVPMPAIAHVHGDHFVVVRSAAGDVIVDDPSIGRLRMSAAAFDRAWDGIVLTFATPDPHKQGTTVVSGSG